MDFLGGGREWWRVAVQQLQWPELAAARVWIREKREMGEMVRI